jgi:hypothetical protein
MMKNVWLVSAILTEASNPVINADVSEEVVILLMQLEGLLLLGEQGYRTTSNGKLSISKQSDGTF